MQEKLYFHAECLGFSMILKVNLSEGVPFYYLNVGNIAESVIKGICYTVVYIFYCSEILIVCGLLLHCRDLGL